MRTAFYSLLVLASVVILSSCQKTSVYDRQTNIEGTWSITGIRSDRAYDFNGDGYQETDIYGSYTSCGRDIAVSFESGGYGQMRQGCNARWQNISWQLSDNTLRISLPDDELYLQLQQLDDYTIRGTDQVTVNGNYFNITYTFQRR